MDDATRLIGDLQQKLAHLDHKVAAYRQDMAAEFTRYSRDLLQNIPEDISADVRRGLAASLSQYPALGPELERADLASLPSVDAAAATNTTTTTLTTADTDAKSNIVANIAELSPLLPAKTKDSTTTAITTDDSPASPDPLLASPVDDREVQLQGVFIPSFLPLLNRSTEASPKPLSSTTTPPPAASATPDAASVMGHNRQLEGTPNSSQRPSTANASLMPNRPHHERKGTNDTTSSGTSETGEHKARRSALRRSSTGGSKPPPSPRRVRFEFEGGEVLPTSSPRTSEVSLVQSHSLHSKIVPEPAPAPEDDSMSAEAILGPDEDNEPPPKKVSSSQALRALSRTPLDANTIWTVINADSPEPSSERSSPRNLASPSSSRSSLANSPSRKANMQAPPKEAELTVPRTKKLLKSPPPEREERDSDDSDSSDDDFLAMAKPKSFANKRAIRSPPSRSPTRAKTSPPISPSPQPATSTLNATVSKQPENPTSPVVEAEEEGIFDFEGLSSSKAPVKPDPIPEEEEEEEDNDDEEGADEAENATPKGQTPVIYSTSPAVNIPPPRAERAEPHIPAHLMAGSVGSYRGRPVSMPVVKDPQVYAQAASLRDVNSFIGGLDGDTGTDEGDLASYRASVGQALFSGTPRSLTERMMMEDAQAARRAAASQRHP